MISSKTSFLALIGNPVNHSLSPIMQNAAIKYLGLDLVYLAIPCKDEDFNSTINTLKKINCKGLNITIPFKEKVLDLCSEISPTAKKIKAINTLKLNEKNEWSGTNTDIEGFIYPLKKYDLKEKKGIVLGSGGASRAAIQGLLELKLSEINVISRNKNTLKRILNDFPEDIKGIIYEESNVLNNDLIAEADVIVNSTPVGMKGITNEENFIPFGKNLWKALSSKTIIYDLIYNPRPTELLKYGLKKNCIAIDGLDMLVAQGAKSLSYWTEVEEVPIEIMKDALKNSLKI
tara:strand:+ start:26040 stop:26906 length:867 start_codon:yes stop_codon:yes gene_type:complete